MKEPMLIRVQNFGSRLVLKYRDKDGETDMESREVFNQLNDGGEAKRNPSCREEEKLCHHLHINAFSC